MAKREAKQYRLGPAAIAESLFCLVADRDERASQLCAETLLTLVQNKYTHPRAEEDLISPKRELFAVRSLAVGENFLGGRPNVKVGDGETSADEFGASLARADDFRGSANLSLAQATLQGLLDPETQRGQPGAWLLRPFHESLLWYDARKPNPRSAAYTVRKVHMRGTGITLARILLDPPKRGDKPLGRSTVDAIRSALNEDSPLSQVSEVLESALPSAESRKNARSRVEDDELDSWGRALDPRLEDFANGLLRHSEGVMCQSNTSGPAKLWQFRTILALDLALHLLRCAWEKTDSPVSERFILASVGGPPRSENVIRQRSEDSFRRARTRLSEATIATLAERMRELRVKEKLRAFGGEFRETRLANEGNLESVSAQLAQLSSKSSYEDFDRLARIAVETSNYTRSSEDGFRVLLESIGMVASTGSYRFITLTPDVLSAMVGSLSAHMPMSSREFFEAVHREWGIVVDQESAASTTLTGHVDGAALARNSRRTEQLMSEAGLALGLSDRTTVVGELVARRPQK